MVIERENSAVGIPRGGEVMILDLPAEISRQNDVVIVAAVNQRARVPDVGECIFKIAGRRVSVGSGLFGRHARCSYRLAFQAIARDRRGRRELKTRCRTRGLLPLAGILSVALPAGDRRAPRFPGHDKAAYFEGGSRLQF
jgi:hypothetical protein